MSEVNLSNSVRTSLSSLQTTADLLSDTQQRLATGNRVNSALDDPTSFFTASALNSRASDLSSLVEDQQQAVQVVEAANDGITAIEDLLDQAGSLARSALATDDLSERADLASQFDDILGQIEDLAGDADFNGINLLDSENSSDLTVVFNEDNTSSLTVEGVNFTDVTEAFGLDRISSVNNANPTSGTTTNAQTRVAAADFNTTDTFSFSVGNSNGSTSNFNVTLEDDFVAAADATLDVDSASFADGDTLDVTVGSGSATTVTLVDDEITAGTLSVTDGTGATNIDLTNASAGDSIEFTGGNGVSFNVTLDSASAGGDFSALASLIDAGATAAGADISTTGTTSGQLELSSRVGDVSFDTTPATTGGTFAGAATTQTSSDFAAGDGIDAGDIQAALTAASITDVTAAAGTGTNVTLSSSNNDFTVDDGNGFVRASDVDGSALVTESGDVGLTTAEIQTQIQAAIDEAGVNLTVGTESTAITFESATGDISVTSNAATNALSVSSSDTSDANNVAFIAGNGAGSDFADTDSINQTLQQINDALGTLEAAATSLGSDLSTIEIRTDFTENLINTLEEGAGLLTLADLNEEGANLLTLQTRQQLASTSLSFATQADQSVLQLL